MMYDVGLKIMRKNRMNKVVSNRLRAIIKTQLFHLINLLIEN